MEKLNFFNPDIRDFSPTFYFSLETAPFPCSSNLFVLVLMIDSIFIVTFQSNALYSIASVDPFYPPYIPLPQDQYNVRIAVVVGVEKNVEYPTIR